MFTKWRFIIVILVLIAALPSLNSQAKPNTTIDLEQDKNQDGIPDALAAEIAQIAASPDQDAAIQDFVKRLPYSAETRALQAQAARLQASPSHPRRIAIIVRTNDDRSQLCQNH